MDVLVLQAELLQRRKGRQDHDGDGNSDDEEHESPSTAELTTMARQAMGGTFIKLKELEEACKIDEPDRPDVTCQIYRQHFYKEWGPTFVRGQESPYKYISYGNLMRRLQCLLDSTDISCYEACPMSLNEYYASNCVIGALRGEEMSEHASVDQLQTYAISLAVRVIRGDWCVSKFETIEDITNLFDPDEGWYLNEDGLPVHERMLQPFLQR